MKKGESYFLVPYDMRSHRRMAAMLRIYTREKPVTVWEMTCAALGKERALELGRRKAVHLCERCINAAQRCDFIRRLPIRLLPGDDEPYPKEKYHRALAFTITDAGEKFVRDHDRYIRDKALGLNGNKSNMGIKRARNKRRIDKVQAKYLRRMRDMTRS